VADARLDPDPPGTQPPERSAALQLGAGAAHPVLPIDQVLAEQRGFLVPDSMAPSVGVMRGDQEGSRRARP
jgi:hypothetical protein